MEKIVENSKYHHKNGLLPYPQLVELQKNLISLKQLQLSIEKGAPLSRAQLHRALGGNKHLPRKLVKDITFDEAMKHFVEGALMNVIERNEILPIDKPCL